MSELNYTKGEWKARYAGHDLPWYIDAENREVAKVLVYPVYPDNEAQANAQLISATPALYKAVRQALIDIDRTGYTKVPHIVEMQKALAKAEGK